MEEKSSVASLSRAAKVRRTNAWRTLALLGICEWYAFKVTSLNVERLMTVTDKELLSTRSCGPVTLKAIHKIQQTIKQAIEL